jgi:3-hydroxyacyl-CoA dehydrogenase
MTGTAHERVTIVGAGMIGTSWAALFQDHGFDVCAFDPSDDARREFADKVRQLRRASAPARGSVVVTDDLEQAVRGATLIHEAAPERVELKRSLLKQIQDCAGDTPLIASSTSSLRHSDIVSDCPAPGRIVIAHPFNPPHLVPLVELFGTDPAAVESLAELYRALGKKPVVMNKEMTGHIANRLSSALWREALYLLQEGVASVEDIDTAITAGPGLRWAVFGPFLTYHLGGGSQGIEGYLHHLGDSQVQRWKALGEPTVDDALYAAIIAGVQEEAGGRAVEDLARHRDRALRAILDSLHGSPSAPNE